MKVMQCSIDHFTEGKKFFKIPVYQRKYDWQQEQCRQLFDDIKKIIETGKPHFLGTFVFQNKLIDGSNNFQEFIIIDGQQRITSIILLARLLCNLIDDEETREELQANFVKHANGKGMKNKCKLIPTEYDKNIFEKIMSHENFDEISFDEGEKSSAIYKNFVFFREKISECEHSPEKIYKAIQNLNIVGINVETGENPQEIFESLNSTGLRLTQSDLIRNYLLMSLDYNSQEDLYKKYWLEIEKLLRSSEEVENFMIQYLILKRRSSSVMSGNKNTRLSPKKLYEIFKRHFEEIYIDDDKGRNVENCLRDIYRYAKFYSRVNFNDEEDFDKLSALEKKFYELTFLLDATNSPIILMYLYDKFDKKFFDEETFIKFLDAMISLAFRAKVCEQYGITAQFAGNVILKLDKLKTLDEDSFWQTITFGSGKYSFPNDENFKNALTENKIFSTLRTSGCKYLLYSLEKNSECASELPKFSSATVEHIMPQKLNDAWKNYLESKNELAAHEKFLHTLGNLTLMSRENNSKVSNADFGKKKSEYEGSGFFYTRDLKKYPDWTSAQIQMRAKKLANAAINIWTLPEEYNSAAVDVGNIFTLDSDFGICTGKKPATLSISNNEQRVRTWRDLLEKIIKTLYALDKDNFKSAAQKDNLPKSLFATDSENLRGSFITIDSDFYMATNFDTERCLKIIKNLVENFDSICDTNFSEEIYFTLKK